MGSSGPAASCSCPRFWVSRCATATRAKCVYWPGWLSRLDLRANDRATAELATALASKCGIRAADATHLASAVGIGARRFITNNHRGFAPTITELQVTYPADLPESSA